MKILPTNYQREALKKIKESKDLFNSSTIIQMASGLGKTYLAGFESMNYIGKILFICHRKEILKQALSVFGKIYEGTHKAKRSMGYYHGSIKQPNSTVLFASVLTLRRNLKKFDPSEFDFIVFDEFHHFLAKSYRVIFDYFTPKFWLGMTATPYRMDDPDGIKLQELFDSKIVYNYGLARGIETGNLVPFNLIFHQDNIDYSKIRFRHYKYNEKDLNKALLIKERDDAIIGEYKNHFRNRKCIGFCVSVKHVNRMVNLFNKNGIDAEGITYLTSKKSRETIEGDFETGNLRMLFTKDIYNEGIDIPDIDGILLLRPTISKTIFYQQIGRGLRKISNKKDLMILDFVGNYKNAYLHHKWLAVRLKKVYDISRDKKPKYIYPLGCKVMFTKEIIDLFELQEPITKERLIGDFYRVKKLLGSIPTSREMDKLGKWSSATYSNYFGKPWTKFLEEIGEKHKNYNISKKEMIGDVIRVKKKLNELPSAINYTKYGKFCYATIKKRFGKSWDDIIKEIFNVKQEKKYIISHCIICNKEIEGYWKWGYWNRRYCSRKCKEKDKYVELECLYCKNKFFRPKKGYKYKFCSKQCYINYIKAYSQRPEVKARRKAKWREYRQRPEVKARRKQLRKVKK